MTPWSVIVLLVAFSAMAEGRFDSRQREGVRSARGFQVGAAPDFGAGGAWTVCGCAAVTGDRGEALSMTRASSGYCSASGSAATGLGNASMVLCGNNTPRIALEQGTVSYLRESARTNSILRSQQLDNAAWASIGVGVASPTVTADYAVAPDGTTTAERIQFNATTAGQESILYEGAGCPVATDTGSVYIKGTSGNGTVAFIINRGGGNFACGTCAYVSTSWSRCINAGAVVGSSGNFILGNESSICGNATYPNNDVLLWGAQCEAGAWASSYIPTTTVAVTRAADSALSGASSLVVGPNVSMSAVTTYLGFTSASQAVDLGATTARATFGRDSATTVQYQLNTTAVTPTVTITALTPYVAMLADNAGSRSAAWGGVSQTAPAATMSAGATAVLVGALDAWTGAVCVDGRPTRCVP